MWKLFLVCGFRLVVVCVWIECVVCGCVCGWLLMLCLLCVWCVFVVFHVLSTNTDRESGRLFSRKSLPRHSLAVRLKTVTRCVCVCARSVVCVCAMGVRVCYTILLLPALSTTIVRFVLLLPRRCFTDGRLNLPFEASCLRKVFGFIESNCENGRGTTRATASPPASIAVEVIAVTQSSMRRRRSCCLGPRCGVSDTHLGRAHPAD